MLKQRDYSPGFPDIQSSVGASVLLLQNRGWSSTGGPVL